MSSSKGLLDPPCIAEGGSAAPSGDPNRGRHLPPNQAPPSVLDLRSKFCELHAARAVES
jgi:hypothetical protein